MGGLNAIHDFSFTAGFLNGIVGWLSINLQLAFR